MKMIKINNENFVSARDLYSDLGIRMNYSTWIKANIERAYLEQNKDFVLFTEESTGGRPSITYLLKKDAAINVILMSGGKNAKIVRDNVIKLYKQHDEGRAFTNEQFEALIDISKSMTLVFIQKEVLMKAMRQVNKSIAQKMKLGTLIWDDTKDNPLGINQYDVTERKELFSTGQKQLL